MKSNWLFAVLLSLPFAGDLRAQGFTDSDVVQGRHRDFTGKPCLETTAGSKPLLSDPHVFSHIVTVENHCPQLIKARICYHGMDSCTDVDLPGGSRKEQVIGIFPAMREFRYDVKEQFKERF
jgi:hypothetical protein